MVNFVNRHHKYMRSNDIKSIYREWMFESSYRPFPGHLEAEKQFLNILIEQPLKLLAHSDIAQFK